MGFIGRAVAPAPITANDVPDLPASKITSGTISNDRLNVTQFDDNKIVNDLSTLGLRVHTQENLNVSNTNSASFDVFQDSSGITNLTNVLRNTDEFVSSIQSVTTSNYFTSSNMNVNSNSAIDQEDSTNKHSRIRFNTSSASGNYFNHSNSAVLTGDFTFQYKVASHGFNGNGDPTNNYWFQFGVSPSISGINSNQSPYKRADSDGFQVLFIGNQGNGNSQFRIFNGTGSGVSTLHDISGVTLAENDIIQWSRTGSTFTLNRNGSAVQVVSGYTSSADMYAIVGSGYNGSYTSSNNPEYKEVTYSTTSSITNATGSFEGATITAGSSTSKMGAVITYQDNAGTNTLNTDIILKLSADNGSNYSTATLTALPDFATGIKMAKVNDLSVTAGTQLKYKIEFANQSSGSKEARIRGVSLQY